MREYSCLKDNKDIAEKFLPCYYDIKLENLDVRDASQAAVFFGVNNAMTVFWQISNKPKSYQRVLSLSLSLFVHVVRLSFWFFVPCFELAA